MLIKEPTAKKLFDGDLPFLRRVTTNSAILLWNKVPAVSGRFVVALMLCAPSGHIPLRVEFLEWYKRRLKS